MRTVAAPDLVEQRSKLIFGRPAATVEAKVKRIGIPKALMTHSLYPLYSTFFSGLDMEVVLSDVDPRGELKSNAGFCFPAQIAHGAVLDLVQRGVGLIFLPHVMRMLRRAAWKESYLCPITQASPNTVHLICYLWYPVGKSDRRTPDGTNRCRASQWYTHYRFHQFGRFDK
ncbi:MAG: acyl-CoA dehydratase activase-related protein, partial [Deltaproteobacteria bacterium]|nr:acyl-CoA dehydratase activase-related protein [Deltaproteobacteria bacterium]